MTTPIHRELNVPAGDLTWNLIELAVKSRLAETTDLDWKSRVHETREPKGKEEFAKDLAAMANSGGGWIVYGVKDDREDRAAEIQPIDSWTTVLEQRLRDVARRQIAPGVLDLRFHPVQNPAGPGLVVAMEIPDGSGKPHFVTSDQWLCAPARNGPHTYFLTEPQIETAYRRRQEAHAEREAALPALYEEAIEELGSTKGVTFVFAAIPHQPPQAEVDWGEPLARDVMTFTDPSPFYHQHRLWAGGTFRPNLRRWEELVAGDRASVRAIHRDGKVTVTQQLGGWSNAPEPHYPAGKPNQCRSQDLERSAADAVELVQRVAQKLSVQGGYTIRAGLVGLPDPAQPIKIRPTQAGTNILLDEDYSTSITSFKPVTMDLDPAEPTEEVLDRVRDLCLDLVNQGGVKYLAAIGTP